MMEKSYEPVVRVIMCPDVNGYTDPLGVMFNPTREEAEKAMEFLAGMVDTTHYTVDGMYITHVPVVRKKKEEPQ